ncbi:MULTISPECIES: ATP-dependent nuclease [unclassified Chitinophaga]
MNIYKLKVKNYRLLKDFELDLESILSLVIGKNNSGKTSLLSVLEKFIGEKSSRRTFSFDDFNLEFKEELKFMIESEISEDEPFPFLGISLKLFIEYDDTDDLANISRVMMDLDPNNKVIVLGFEYALTAESFKKLKSDFNDFSIRQQLKKVQQNPSQNSNSDPQRINTRVKDIFYFLKENQKDYFKVFRKSIEYNIDERNSPHENDKNFIDLDKEKISLDKILNFKFISAKREVSNKEPDKALSSLSSEIYKRTEENEKESQAIENFKDTLSDTDELLDNIYSTLFSKVITKVEQFGGVKKGDSVIEIISTLQHKELLHGNTTVMYKHNDKYSLPENYNGLGYMNLISMIFEIEILLQEFRKEVPEKPSDINILFIEEPEAHTHPQMQYIFIKNIKSLLEYGIIRQDGESRKLQTIISTHSSHIVSESQFDDIKYFKREKNNIIAKNLKDLKKEYKESKQYDFLKQYLTISRAELFFADKAILIEGDTERILIPAMMKKLDIEEENKPRQNGNYDNNLLLLSQNISIVEVGAYSQIFEQFIDFLGIKSLIITDLDAVDGKGEACEVSIGVAYSNEAINFFFKKPTLENLKQYNLTNKIFSKKSSWINDPEGNLCIVYQIPESAGCYNARSFEDAFIFLNREFVNSKKDDFRGLKNRTHFEIQTNSAYYLAQNCIVKKTHFALDILFHSDSKFSNWQIPTYIKEGLQWLKKK